MTTLIDFMERKTQRDINRLYKEADHFSRAGCRGSVASCVGKARALQHYVLGADTSYADNDPPVQKWKRRPLEA